MTKRVTESPDESTGKPLDGHDDHQHAGEMTAEESGSRVQQRRNLLKTISGGSVLAAGGLLPNQWAKPVIQTVLLPAHAETSPPSGNGDDDTTTTTTTTGDNGTTTTTTTGDNGTTTTTTTQATDCTDTQFAECEAEVTSFEPAEPGGGGGDGSYTAKVSGSVVPGTNCSLSDLEGAELLIEHQINTANSCEFRGNDIGSGSDGSTTVQSDGTYEATVSGVVTGSQSNVQFSARVSFVNTSQFGNDETICCESDLN